MWAAPPAAECAASASPPTPPHPPGAPRRRQCSVLVVIAVLPMATNAEVLASVVLLGVATGSAGSPWIQSMCARLFVLLWRTLSMFSSPPHPVDARAAFPITVSGDVLIADHRLGPDAALGQQVQSVVSDRGCFVTGV